MNHRRRHRVALYIYIISRLSGDVAEKLQDDIYGPTILAKKFSELYDNEFADAFQELYPTGSKGAEEAAIKKLLFILKVMDLVGNTDEIFAMKLCISETRVAN